MTTLTLPYPSAKQWNQDLMRTFRRVLRANPSVDLLSLFSRSYHNEHQKAHLDSLAYGAGAVRINYKTIYELHMVHQDDEEADLLAAIPPNYKRCLRVYSKSNRREAVEVKPLSRFKDFRKDIDIKDTARVVYPLSEDVERLLVRYQPNPQSPDPVPFPYPNSDSESNWSWYDTTGLLTSPLHNLLWPSTKLWENPVRGIVLKLNDSLVAKFITSSTRLCSISLNVRLKFQHRDRMG